VRDLAQQHIHKDPTPPRKLNKQISPRVGGGHPEGPGQEPERSIPLGERDARRDRRRAPREDREDVRGSPLRCPPRGPQGAPHPRRDARPVGGAGRRRPGDRPGACELPSLDRSGGEGALSRAEPVETREAPAAARTFPRTGACGGPSRNFAAAAEASSAEASAAASAPARRDLVRVPDVRAFYDYFAEETLASKGFEVRFVYDYQRGYANRGVTWATESRHRYPCAPGIHDHRLRHPRGLSPAAALEGPPRAAGNPVGDKRVA
jgi:hypothetical protein